METRHLGRASSLFCLSCSLLKSPLVRALYTVNSAPQYLLALSPRKFPVNIISPSPSSVAQSAFVENGSPVLYARAPLRPFLDMICTSRFVHLSVANAHRALTASSPDVVQVQPGKRDYTVYVLDPLEARNITPLAYCASSSTLPLQAGVAIGLGLLSTALGGTDCDLMVTGTVVSDSIQEDRLEVVFALREVRKIVPTSHN